MVMDSTERPGNGDPLDYVHRHLRFGWWSLLFFLTLGMLLEAMHGFKVGWYLDASNSTRRLMWTLSHAHGTLLALVNIAFAATLALLPGQPARSRRVVSPCLMGATLLLPGGFLLGGVVVYDGDPGVGIFLLPVGALLLFVAVLLTASGVASTRRASTPPPHGTSQ